MTKPSAFLIAAVCALFVTACGDSDSPAPSETEPAASAMESAAESMADASSGAETAGANAGDAVELDPGHYSVEIENDAVRVLRISYGPGEESVMHSHPASVAVFLTDFEGEMTLPDGSTETASVPAGTVSFSPSATHLPKNVSDSRFELVEIELKPGDADPIEYVGPDPVEADPEHYATEFENDLVRVLRITYGPGGESVMHYHPQNVAVFLTDTSGRMTLPDGSVVENTASAGDVVFNDAGQHLPRTNADSETEVILVELK